MIVLIVLLSLLTILYFLYRKEHCKLPPGPTKYPLVGSFHLLLGAKKSLIEIVQNDRKKYGDMSSFSVFGINIVFLNTTELIRQMVAMEQCAGRPALMGQFKGKGPRRGLLDPDIGPSWKDQKRFVLKTLRDYGFGKKSEQNIQDEAKNLINFISEKICLKDNEDFPIKDVFNIPVVNVIWKMVANKAFSMESSDGLKFVKILEEILTIKDPMAALPVIGKYTSVFKRRIHLMEEMKESMFRIIEEHEKTIDETEPRDLIDNYLLEMKKGREGFTKDELVITIFDLFAAGSETTSTTLRWAIMFLILNPEVQRRCHKELDEISDSIPSLSDMTKLQYCQATILETLRHGSIAPGTLIHKALETVKIGNYSFPRGTLLLGNFLSTHFDSEYWEDPEKFTPERFLDSDGRILMETPNFFPFSIGKRVCLGESLAKTELFIFLTSLLKNFSFHLPSNHPKPNIQDFNIVITKIPNEYHCVISERTQL